MMVTTGSLEVMTAVGIAELKAGLSAYLARVSAGEEVLVTDRGRPVARVVPVADGTRQISELERRGLVRAPQKELSSDFLDRPRPRSRAGSVRKALVEERREGR